MPKLCEFESCRNRATYGINCNPIRCKEHKNDNMKLSSKLCICGKQPNYNLQGLPPKFCSECKPINAVDVKHKYCIENNCNIIANYNYENETKPLYCSSHKLQNMIDIIHKRCFFIGCNVIANYNYENETKPLYCSSHKLQNMIDIYSNKCLYPNCKTRPVFNFKNLNKAIYCSKHKLINMINVKDKPCIYTDCNILPSYNFKSESKPIYCFNHKLNDMVNVKNICSEPNCNKYPLYNFKNIKPALYCFQHKKPGMINNNYQKCLNEFCEKIPSYNYESETNGIYCLNHKLENMINVHHTRCKSENCQTRGNKNYKGYCTNCFQHLFPTDPLTFQIRSKTKEIAVRDFINAKFEGFHHDKPLWYNETACDCTTKRRIDHRKLINGTLLCVETDKNQHKSYSKSDEEARYNDLFMAYGGKFIFIRFNPDKYKDKNGKSCNPMLVNRLPILENEINKQIKRIENNENTELLEVIELYYDKSI